MPRHAHRPTSILLGALMLSCTFVAMGLLLRFSDMTSATVLTAAPLSEGYPYPPPYPTPEPMPDLIADKLEVTQAVQDLNNSVRLVENKRTFVRFHVHSASGIYAATARLTVQQGAATQVLAPLNPGGRIDVRTAPDRAASNHAFLFELPDGFKTGAVTLTAQLNPNNSPGESNLGNNQAASLVTFEPVPAINLVAYNLGYHIGNTTFIPAANHQRRLLEWLRQAYPLSQLNVWSRSLDLGAGQTDAEGNLIKPSCGDVNSTLLAGKQMDLIFGSAGANAIPVGAHYYGLVSDGDGGQLMRGCAMDAPDAVASGPAGTGNWGWDFDGSYADWYGGHELAHTYGRAHAEFCDALGGAAYPYRDGRISPSLAGDSALYGFNIGDQSIYGPQWKDIMTYCSYQWVSDFTYEGLMTYFQTQPVATAGLLVEPAGDRLLIGGAIDPNTNVVSLQPILRLPNVTEVTPRIPGPYAIVLLNSSGQELTRYPFTPAATTGGPAETPGDEERESYYLVINELVPVVDGTKRVDIRGPDDQALVTVFPGSRSPEIELIEPSTLRALDGGPVTVAWNASDPDNDPLYFTVQYSADGGENWIVVAQHVQGQSVAIDPINLPASDAGRFRVWATDGLNTAFVESATDAELPNHAPIVEILAPADGTTYAAGQTVTLEGSGYDIDTGSLAGDQLQWASSRDGDLGNGESLSTAALSLGAHIITLAANDGQGGSDQATIQITILDSFNEQQTPNSLVVGADLVALDPGHGAAAAVVAVDNQHAGARISWAATADVPWLRLSRAQGFTPDMVAIMYVHTGLAQGVYQGTVTFTSNSVPGQRAELPVVLTLRDAKVLLPWVGR